MDGPRDPGPDSRRGNARPAGTPLYDRGLRIPETGTSACLHRHQGDERQREREPVEHQHRGPVGEPQAEQPVVQVARYRAGQTQRPAYAVMAWWDYGYEIIRLGRRVPRPGRGGPAQLAHSVSP